MFDASNASTVGFDSSVPVIAPRSGLYYVQLVLTVESFSPGEGGIELVAGGRVFAASWMKLQKGTISITGMTKLEQGDQIEVVINLQSGEILLEEEKHMNYLIVQKAAID